VVEAVVESKDMITSHINTQMTNIKKVEMVIPTTIKGVGKGNLEMMISTKDLTNVLTNSDL
jgi:hypothetical protein